MFNDFDPKLLDDPGFKEDAVREVIVTPLLTRLGYTPSGKNRIVRSKLLKHPFIYAGTRKVSVTMIPDYTLLNDRLTLLVLDAKRPSESILSRENVQQAYSYAIHPEIRCKHFALCNGRDLAIFNVDEDDPLLIVPFDEFETRWKEIEKYLGPQFLEEPSLRKYDPDLGAALIRLGLIVGGNVTLLPAQINLVAKIDDELMSATSACEFAGRPHCVSFDFHPNLLPKMLSGLPPILASAFDEAVRRSPFMAAAELAIELDIDAKLGPAVTLQYETFHPLIIQDIMESRFNFRTLSRMADDIPAHVFRLRKAYVVK